MLKRGKLIVLSGVDGAGKSTQIELLQSYYRSCSVSAQSLWFRPGYGREVETLKKLIRSFRPNSIPVQGSSREREDFFGDRKVRYLWATLALLDTLFQYGVKIRVSLALGRTVICDRYLEDGFWDLRYKFPEVGFDEHGLFKLLRFLCPSPDVAFLLTLSWDEMEKRVNSKYEPFPDSEERRKIRYGDYMQMAHGKGNHLVLDCSGDIESVHALILGELRHAGKLV